MCDDFAIWVVSVYKNYITYIFTPKYEKENTSSPENFQWIPFTNTHVIYYAYYSAHSHVHSTQRSTLSNQHFIHTRFYLVKSNLYIIIILNSKTYYTHYTCTKIMKLNFKGKSLLNILIRKRLEHKKKTLGRKFVQLAS